MQAKSWTNNLLRELVYQFGHDTSFIEDVFGCNLPDIAQKKFTLSESFAIADRLGVSLQQILDSKVDWKVVKSRLISPHSAISDSYLIDGGTYMSSIRSIISFISLKYSHIAAQTILQELQISQAALLNDDLKLNIRFVNHLFRLLIDKFGLTKEDIDLMTVMVHRYSMRNSVTAMAKICKNDGDILNLMVQNANKYEENFDYWLEKEKNDTVIFSRSRFELEGSSIEKMSHPLIWFKLSTVKNITTLMGRNPMRLLNYEVGEEKGIQTFKFRVGNTNSLSCLRQSSLH
jgi:hypothetical protein